ncbi:RHS repeat domain-containing protein, partial [Proteus mirabilis]
MCQKNSRDLKIIVTSQYLAGNGYESLYFALPLSDNEPEWRVVEHWLKDGKCCLEHTELTYDLAQRTLTTVETGGETTFRRWNEQQQIIEYTNALNETWWFEWDTSRLLTKAIAPDGSEWGYTYDERGNLTQST